MKRRTYQIMLWLPVVVIGIQHALGIMSKVQCMPADAYGRIATEIRVTERWRYGYVCGQHGAVLVETRNTTNSKPAQRSDGDAELSQAMLVELRAYPRRSLLEALLYGFVLTYALVFVPRLRRWLSECSSAWPWAMLRESVFWVCGWTVLVGPLLWLGYGASIYTTWAGPGFLSYSGPYPGMPIGFAGETVSYRPLLEAVSAWPVVVIQPAWFKPVIPDMSFPQYIWLAGTVWWGSLGSVVGLVLCVRSVRSTPVKAEADCMTQSEGRMPPATDDE
jgi:hypothetical protein